MTAEAPARATLELRMIEGFVDGAYAISLALSEAAADERDLKTRLAIVDAFLRASQAVRLGVRLSMALRSGTTFTAAARRGGGYDAEVEASERPDPVESERPERAEAVERERDRDYEAVSLPKFLSTLGVVVREAERLGDHLPEAAVSRVTDLRGVLAQAQAAPAPPGSPPVAAVGAAMMSRPPPGRSALLGSAASGIAGLRSPVLHRPPPRGPG